MNINHPGNTHISYDPRPIGIFDSGIGGLTVLKTLLKSFPHESFLYLGDSARLPYGNKSPQTIHKYCEQNIKYLLNHNVKAIILACNSASSFYTQKKVHNVPIYSVIGPGAFSAYQNSKNQNIGILGTKATVNGKAYIKAIHQLNPNAKVSQQSCPLFVPLAEEGVTNNPITKLTIQHYLEDFLKVNSNIDTLVLGCTHYPILRPDIQEFVGNHIKLVDSAEALSDQLKNEILNKIFIANSSNKQRTVHIQVTDTTETLKELAYKIIRLYNIDLIESIDMGQKIKDIERERKLTSPLT